MEERREGGQAGRGDVRDVGSKGWKEGEKERASERWKEGWTEGGGGGTGEGTEGRRDGGRDERTEGRRDGGSEDRKKIQRVTLSLLLPSLPFPSPLLSSRSLARAPFGGLIRPPHSIPSAPIRPLASDSCPHRHGSYAPIPVPPSPPIHPPTAPSLPAGRRGRRPRRPLRPIPPHRRTGQAQQGQARERTQLPRQLLSAGWAERGGGEGGHGRGFAQRHVHAHRGTIIGGLQRT